MSFLDYKFVFFLKILHNMHVTNTLSKLVHMMTRLPRFARR